MAICFIVYHILATNAWDIAVSEKHVLQVRLRTMFQPNMFYPQEDVFASFFIFSFVKKLHQYDTLFVFFSSSLQSLLRLSLKTFSNMQSVLNERYSYKSLKKTKTSVSGGFFSPFFLVVFSKNRFRQFFYSQNIFTTYALSIPDSDNYVCPGSFKANVQPLK